MTLYIRLVNGEILFFALSILFWFCVEPIHCEWDDWIIGECSQTCGTGTRVNTRTKKVLEEYGGTCSGQASKTEECNTNPCPGIKILIPFYKPFPIFKVLLQ